MKKPKLIALQGGKDTTPVLDKGERDAMMLEFYQGITIDVLARTLWGEARGEGTGGMEAVASVILNRVEIAQKKGSYWWGNNIIQVCQKPYQFSCWNRADPNFRKLQAVDAHDLYFATAQRIARRALAGTLKDQTGGATHYHANNVLPYWAKRKTPTASIGRHIFYHLEG